MYLFRSQFKNIYIYINYIYIQGGPKVALQLFHYLFHVLDLIYFGGVVKNKVYERNPPHSG